MDDLDYALMSRARASIAAGQRLGDDDVAALVQEVERLYGAVSDLQVKNAELEGRISVLRERPTFAQQLKMLKGLNE